MIGCSFEKCNWTNSVEYRCGVRRTPWPPDFSFSTRLRGNCISNASICPTLIHRCGSKGNNLDSGKRPLCQWPVSVTLEIHFYQESGTRKTDIFPRKKHLPQRSLLVAHTFWQSKRIGNKTTWLVLSQVVNSTWILFMMKKWSLFEMKLLVKFELFSLEGTIYNVLGIIKLTRWGTCDRWQSSSHTRERADTISPGREGHLYNIRTWVQPKNLVRESHCVCTHAAAWKSWPQLVGRRPTVIVRGKSAWLIFPTTAILLCLNISFISKLGNCVSSLPDFTN